MTMCGREILLSALLFHGCNINIDEKCTHRMKAAGIKDIAGRILFIRDQYENMAIK